MLVSHIDVAVTKVSSLDKAILLHTTCMYKTTKNMQDLRRFVNQYTFAHMKKKMIQENRNRIMIQSWHTIFGG